MSFLAKANETSPILSIPIELGGKKRISDEVSILDDTLSATDTGPKDRVACTGKYALKSSKSWASPCEAEDELMKLPNPSMDYFGSSSRSHDICDRSLLNGFKCISGKNSFSVKLKNCSSNDFASSRQDESNSMECSLNAYSNQNKENFAQSPPNNYIFRQAVTPSSHKIISGPYQNPPVRDIQTSKVVQSGGNSIPNRHFLQENLPKSEPLLGVSSPVTPAARLRQRQKDLITPEKSTSKEMNFTPLRPFSLYYTCQKEGDAASGGSIKSPKVAVVFKTPTVYLRHHPHSRIGGVADYMYQKQEDFHQEPSGIHTDQHSGGSRADYHEIGSEADSHDNVCSNLYGSGIKKLHQTPTSRFLTRSISAAPAPGYCNPFERGLIESLHGPINFSPNLFKTSTPGSKAPPTFQWSIDEIAILKPADIDETEETQTDIWTTGLNAELEEQAQQAIDTFFSSNVIVPSPWTDSAERKKSFHLPATPCGPKGADSPMIFSLVKNLMRSHGTPAMTPGSAGSSAQRCTSSATSSRIPERQEARSADHNIKRKLVDAAVQTHISLPVDFDLEACLPDHHRPLSSDPGSPLLAGGPGTRRMMEGKSQSKKRRDGSHRLRAREIETASEDSMISLNGSSLPRKLFFTGAAVSPVMNVSGNGSIKRDEGNRAGAMRKVGGHRERGRGALRSSREDNCSSSPVKNEDIPMSPIRRCSTVPLLFTSPKLSPVRGSSAGLYLNNSGLDLNDLQEFDSPDESSIASDSSEYIMDNSNNSVGSHAVDKDVTNYRDDPVRCIVIDGKSNDRDASGFSVSDQADNYCDNNVGTPEYFNDEADGANYSCNNHNTDTHYHEYFRNSSRNIKDEYTNVAVELCTESSANNDVQKIYSTNLEYLIKPQCSAIENVEHKSSGTKQSLENVRYSLDNLESAATGTEYDGKGISEAKHGSSGDIDRDRSPGIVSFQLGTLDSSNEKGQKRKLNLSYSTSVLELSHQEPVNEDMPSAASIDFRNIKESLIPPESLCQNSRTSLSPLVFPSCYDHKSFQDKNTSPQGLMRSNTWNGAEEKLGGGDRGENLPEKFRTEEGDLRFIDDSGDMLLDDSADNMGDSQISVYMDSKECIQPGLSSQQSHSADTGYQSSSLLHLQSSNGSSAAYCEPVSAASDSVFTSSGIYSSSSVSGLLEPGIVSFPSIHSAYKGSATCDSGESRPILSSSRVDNKRPTVDQNMSLDFSDAFI